MNSNVGTNILNDDYVLSPTFIEHEKDTFTMRSQLDSNLESVTRCGFQYETKFSQNETQVYDREVMANEKNYYILKQDMMSYVFVPYEIQESVICMASSNTTRSNLLTSPVENASMDNVIENKLSSVNHRDSTFYISDPTNSSTNDIDRDAHDSVFPSDVLDKPASNSIYVLNSSFCSKGDNNRQNSITKTLRNIKRLPPPIQTVVTESNVDYLPDTSAKTSYDLSCTVLIDASTKCDPVHEKSCNSSVLSYNLEGQTEFISQKEKYYACPDCNKWFKRKSHLITHSRAHSDVRKFKCYKCELSFKTQVNLRFHLESHDKPLKCPHCNKQFTVRRILSRHIRFVHSLNIFECEQCGRKFKNKKNLIRHYGIHSGLKPFSCKICSKSFLHRSSLNTHLRKHSVEECSKCNKSSGSNAENDICSKSLNSVVGVNTASMEEGTVEISTDQHQSESLNVCSCSSLCTENCRNVIENNALLSDGHICKPFSCGICGKLFKLKSSLVTHNKTHFPNKAYKCEECGKTFLKKISYNLHMKQHRGERPEFMCDQCSQSYHSQFNLRRHYLKHTTEKKFQCHICNKKFWMKDALQVHLRSHLKEKNFKCTQCGKTFSHKSSLVTHLRSLHPDALQNSQPMRCSTDILPSH